MTGPSRIPTVPGAPSLAAAITCAAGCALLAAPALACDEEKKPAASAAGDRVADVWVTGGDEDLQWIEMGDGDANVWVVGGDDGDFRWIEMGDDEEPRRLRWRFEGEGKGGDDVFRFDPRAGDGGTTYESWQGRDDDDDEDEAEDDACCGACIVIRLDGHGLGDLIERLLSSRGDRLPRNLDRMFDSLPKGMNRLFGEKGLRIGGPGRLRIEIDEDGALHDLALPKVAKELGGGVGRLLERGSRPRVRFGGGDDGEMVVEVEADDMHFGGGKGAFGGEVIIKIDDGSGEPRIITKRFGSGGEGKAHREHEVHEEHEEHEVHEVHEGHDADDEHESIIELKLLGEGGAGDMFFGDGHAIDLPGAGDGEQIMVIEVDDGSGKPRIIERRVGPGAASAPEGPRRLRMRRGGEGEGPGMVFIEEGEDDDAPRVRVKRKRLPGAAAAPAPPAPRARAARPERPARPDRPDAPRLERRRIAPLSRGADRDLDARLERLSKRLERLEELLEKLMERRENRRTDSVR